MFEKEIKYIYDFNLNRVKQLGVHFTFNALSSISVHPAILNYISAEIDYLIFEDRQNLLEKSNFDYSNEQIAKYFNLINQEIKKEKKLSFEYISQLMLHATSFTANYLAQPKWALTKLIFSKNSIMNVNEVRQILNYTYYYNFFKNILDKYLKKKKIVSISKSEMEDLITKINNELFSIHSGRMIDNALSSMSEFFNIGSVDKNKIPLLAVELFLKEKGLDLYIEKLENSRPAEPKQQYTITELKKILDSPLPVKKGNYFDRVLKQEQPASIFKDEIKTEGSTEIKLTVPEKSKESTSEIEPPEIYFSELKPIQENEDLIETSEENKNITETGESINTGEYDSKNDLVDNQEYLEENIFNDVNIKQSPQSEDEQIKDHSEEFKISSNNDLSIDQTTNSEEDIPQQSTKELQENINDTIEYNITTIGENILEQTDESHLTSLLQTDEEETSKTIPDKTIRPIDEIQTELNSALFEDDETKEFPAVLDENISSINSESDQTQLEEFEFESGISESDFVIESSEQERINKPTETFEEGKNQYEISENDLKIPEDEKPFDFDETAFFTADETIEIKSLQDIRNDTINEFALIEDNENRSPVLSEIDEEIKTLSENNNSINIELNQEEAQEEQFQIPNVDEFSEETIEDIIKKETFVFDRKKVRPKDLIEFFSHKQKKKILSNIFNGDAEDFANTINALTECNNYEAAEGILYSLFTSNRIKPNSKEAKILNSAVLEYFTQ